MLAQKDGRVRRDDDFLFRHFEIFRTWFCLPSRDQTVPLFPSVPFLEIYREPYAPYDEQHSPAYASSDNWCQKFLPARWNLETDNETQIEQEHTLALLMGRVRPHEVLRTCRSLRMVGLGEIDGVRVRTEWQE